MFCVYLYLGLRIKQEIFDQALAKPTTIKENILHNNVSYRGRGKKSNYIVLSNEGKASGIIVKKKEVVDNITGNISKK